MCHSNLMELRLVIVSINHEIFQTQGANAVHILEARYSVYSDILCAGVF